MKKHVLLFLLFICMMNINDLKAQGYIFGIMGGPTLSNQHVTGYQREPFLRYHCFIFIESISDITPNSVYARLGYHIKGSAINVRSYFDDIGNEHVSQSYAMEFHNLSASVGIKQRRPLGNLFYSYGFGVRGDYNLKSEYGLFFKGFDGAENKFTYGVNVDVGIEFPLSELVSTTVELGFSPDLSHQLFIPPQYNTGYYYSDGTPVTFPETNLTNLVMEARVGFRFWRKIIYTD